MDWWQYLLLVNLYLVLFYGFYTVLLRSETFFNLNRIYLVASALLSFFIPLIHSEWINKLFITQRVQQTISVYAQPINVYRTAPIEHYHITVSEVLFLVYTIGAVILTFKLVGQLISLKRMIDDPESTGAFTFFKSIRLEANLENRDIIAKHEEVHASQWHSADVMLIEAIAIINWFNPVVYFYKRGVKYIHEYIADRQALKNGTSKADYALLLLSQTLKTSANQLATPFHTQSLLKRRIMMLDKDRSEYVALIKYGFSAPLFMLMLVLSSAAVIKNHTIKLFNLNSDFPSIAQVVKLQDETTSSKRAFANAPAATSSVTDAHSQAILRAKGVSVIKPSPVFVSVEQQPVYKDGMVNFYQFLAANLQYPRAMIRHNIQGRVIIEMTVKKDGSLTDFKSLYDVGYGSAEEAIRVLKLSPRWRPGYQNGRAVRVRYTLPVVFNLVNVKNQPDTITNVTYPLRFDGPADNSAASGNNVVSADKLNLLPDALILLDGKVIPDIKSVDPNYLRDAKVVKNVNKDNVYYILYGAKALNGVLLLESNSPSKPARDN